MPERRLVQCIAASLLALATPAPATAQASTETTVDQALRKGALEPRAEREVTLTGSIEEGQSFTRIRLVIPPPGSINLSNRGLGSAPCVSLMLTEAQYRLVRYAKRATVTGVFHLIGPLNEDEVVTAVRSPGRKIRPACETGNRMLPYLHVEHVAPVLVP